MPNFGAPEQQMGHFEKVQSVVDPLVILPGHEI